LLVNLYTVYLLLSKATNRAVSCEVRKLIATAAGCCCSECVELPLSSIMNKSAWGRVSNMLRACVN
jgi:hypothetical protein